MAGLRPSSPGSSTPPPSRSADDRPNWTPPTPRDGPPSWPPTPLDKAPSMTEAFDASGSRRPELPSRRHFLRGVGASIALPALASLGTPRLLLAGEAGGLATTASGAPLRAAFV